MFARLLFAAATLWAAALTPVPALASQASYAWPVAGPMSFATFITTYLQPGTNALATCHSGTSAPANGPSSAALTQQCWWDTSATPWAFKTYDGTSWVSIFTLNASAHTAAPTNANLAGLAGLTTAANKCSYWTGAGTPALLDCLAWARTFISAADASAGRTALGVAIGSDVQAYNANLAGLAGLTTAANKCSYWTGAGTPALIDCLAWVRTFISAADASAGRAALGVAIGSDVQAYNANLAGLAGLTTAANKCSYWTAAGTPALIDCLAWARTFISAADASAGRTALGLGTAAVQNTGTSGANVPLLNGNNAWSGTSSHSALVDAQERLRVSSFVTSTQIGADQNNYTGTDGSNTCTTKRVLRISSDAARNVTGLSCSQADGDLFYVYNAGSFAITFKDESASSTAANRFGFGADLALASKQGATFVYDGTASRYRQVGGPSASGGGAGTLTSVATTYPICGGTITTSGTLTYCGPFSSGVLAYSSTTALTFTPKNGDLIRINGTVYQIPSAGIAGCATTSAFVNGTGSSSLGATTFYYVFAFVNSGTLTCDFRTDGNGHLADNTAGNIGTEVRVSSGTTRDSSRTLIGMVRTDGSSHFVDSATQRFVRSWYSDRGVSTINGYSTNRTTTSTTPTEINSEIRNEVLVWSGETLVAAMTGRNTHGAVARVENQIAIDSTSTPDDAYSGATVEVAGHSASLAMTLVKHGLAEGYHYITHLGSNGDGNTSTWIGGAAGASRVTLATWTRGN